MKNRKEIIIKRINKMIVKRKEKEIYHQVQVNHLIKRRKIEKNLLGIIKLDILQ